MPDLIAIGYPDESTADEAAAEARRLTEDLMLDRDKQELQEARYGQQAAAL